MTETDDAVWPWVLGGIVFLSQIMGWFPEFIGKMWFQ